MYRNCGILYSNEKEQTSDAHNTRGNLHHIEQKKQNTNDYIGHSSTYKSSKSGKRNGIVWGSMHQPKAVKKSRERTGTRVGKKVTSRSVIREPNVRRVKGNVIIFDLGVYRIIIL